jgi:hypothetical protein
MNLQEFIETKHSNLLVSQNEDKSFDVFCYCYSEYHSPALRVAQFEVKISSYNKTYFLYRETIHEVGVKKQKLAKKVCLYNYRFKFFETKQECIDDYVQYINNKIEKLETEISLLKDKILAVQPNQINNEKEL